MKRERKRKSANLSSVAILAIVAILAVASIGIVVAALRSKSDTPCGAGFTRLGLRCCPTPERGASLGTCKIGVPSSCPAPLVVTSRGCDAPSDPQVSIVHVPKTTLTIGPSDWEAEGRVTPRTIEADAFGIDRFEVTVGQFCAGTLGVERESSSSTPLGGSPPSSTTTEISYAPLCTSNDPARAAFGVSLNMARDFCARLPGGGHLPSEEEWVVAAAGAGGDRPRRYPWGDTGAVCRRAAFGLFNGPCGEGADGPDTVGAHPDGATPMLAIHDLAGNVSEWVETGACSGRFEPPTRRCMAVVRGGSWKTNLATELRTWVRREVSSEERDPTIGFRCAYRLPESR